MTRVAQQTRVQVIDFLASAFQALQKDLAIEGKNTRQVASIVIDLRLLQDAFKFRHADIFSCSAGVNKTN